MLKINKNKDKKFKNILTIIAFIILLILAIKNIMRLGLFIDAILSISAIIVFYKLYNKLNQDYMSYSFFIFALILHTLGLYATRPLGIRFDHYMHFVSGFTITLITDRLFNERLSKMKRAILLVFFSIGVGAVGEIIEWLGYYVLGLGDGFLFYGLGDEGEWNNAILDLIFNSFGSLTFIGLLLFKKDKQF